MKRKHFTFCVFIATAALAYVMGWSMKTGNALLILVAPAAALVFICLCKRSVDEIMEDERIYKISEKASQTSFKVFVPLTAIMGGFLIALEKGGLYNFGREGYALVFSACTLLVLYVIFNLYYGRAGKV